LALSKKDWEPFASAFGDAGCARVGLGQEQGLIPDFAARPVAVALNRLDACTLLQAFGQRPRQRPEPVLEALARIWISTLYGAEWLEKGSSSLVRN